MNFRKILAGIGALAFLAGVTHCPAAQAVEAPEPAAAVATTDVHGIAPDGTGERHADEFLNRLGDASPYAPWQFLARSVCLEGTSDMPLNQVAIDWRNLNGGLISTYVRFTVDGCAASGFGPAQRVKFSKYNDSSPDAYCAVAYTTHQDGYVVRASVVVNTSHVGDLSICQSNRLGVYNHEFGHSKGFAHRPASETGAIMYTYVTADRIHPSTTWEKPRQYEKYKNNPLWP